MKINFHLPTDKKIHSFCPICFSDHIETIYKENKTYYFCSSCKKISERTIVIDPDVIWWIDKKTNELWHESVGVFIMNQSSKILLFNRIKYPFAYTIPAGHLEINEDPSDAVSREALEETGLIIKNPTLFSVEDVYNDVCSRGADEHKWHLFTVQVKKPNPVTINEEGTQPIWVSLEEALKRDLTYPTRYFIEKYGQKLLHAHS